MVPWYYIRQSVAHEWGLAPWELEDDAYADELGRKLEVMRLEAEYG